jgi:uncharacterized protein YhdP
MSETKSDSHTTTLDLDALADRATRSWSSRTLALSARVAFWTALLATLLFVAAIGVTRFWLVPNADQFRPRVVEELSRLTGQRVAIGGFSASWNGWSPEFKVSRLQVLDAAGKKQLELPEVETTLSWRSIFALEPRLSSLTVRDARVVVRRSAQNQLSIAGIDLDLSSSSTDDPQLIEWLLRQRYVQIANGEIEWQDDWRKLPPLRLRDVNLRLVNDGATHRVGLRAVPPPEIASPIEVRSEFTGTRLRKVNEWDGRAYVRADYANLAELARYLPLAIDIARGHGGMQAWLEFDDGVPTAMTLDLAVSDARFSARRQPTQKPTPKPSNASAAATSASTTASNLTTASAPIAFSHVNGRLSWREGKAGFRLLQREASTRTTERWSLRDLAVTTANGQKLSPISAELTLDREGEVVRGGSLQSAMLDLSTIDSLLSVVAPLLPDRALDAVLASAPRGELRQVAATWATTASGAVERYTVELVGERLSWNRVGTFPGAKNVTARVNANEVNGSLVLSPTVAPTLSNTSARVGPNRLPAAARDETNELSIDFGEMFTAPLQIGQAGGRVNWKRINAQGAAPPAAPVAPKSNVSTENPPAVVAERAASAQFEIDVSDFSFENADAKGKINGTWKSDSLGPGIAKLNARIERANAAAVYRYLPTTVDASARRWVEGAIIAGKVANATIKVEGALWHFPFYDGKHGTFEAIAPLTEATLDYADGWPRAQNIDAQVRFKDASFEAAVQRATINGAPVGPVKVAIAEMGNNSVVDIKGMSNAPLDAMLRFVEASPVNEMLGKFTDRAKSSGNAKLNLSLSIPIAHPERTKVDGEIAFDGNRVELIGDIPPLEQVSGRIRFTERDVSARDLATNVLGGAAAVNLTSESGQIRARASGRAELLRVRERFDYPLIDQLTGNVDWRLETSVKTAGPATEVVTRVDGALSPQKLPFDKVMQSASSPRKTGDPVAFSFIRTALPDNRDRIEFDIPAQFHAILERSPERVGQGRTVERAAIDLGAQRTGLPVRGYSIRGDLAKLDTDAALALLPLVSARSAKNVGDVRTDTDAPDFVNLNLRVDRAIVFSQVLTDVSLRAQPSGQRWRLALRSKEATGLISIDRNEANGEVDAVSLRLQKFSWPAAMLESDRLADASVPTTNSNAAVTHSRWPRLDLVADSFVNDNRDLGRLEVKAQPSAESWRIESVKLANSDGSLSASGEWTLPTRGASNSGNTSVNVALEWKDAGKFLQRFGFPRGIERAEGDLKGRLTWDGSPAQFSYQKLAGKFTLATNAGKFSEMDPGIGKLLGIISLQSLPRRLSFNFDDLFGRGFAFDSIAANVSIATGDATTEDFAITGPAARVEIRGKADLVRETAALRVRVFPSVSVATAIGIGLATANPAIGAAAWLGQKIARDPVERMLMQEFEVNGPWSDPEVKQTRGVGATGESTSVNDAASTVPPQPAAPSAPSVPSKQATPAVR